MLNLYLEKFKSEISGRYINTDHILPLLNLHKKCVKISSVGQSVLGQEISMVELGHGVKKVFGWSQMHGNESTTTKALFDFVQFCTQKEHFQSEIEKFLNEYTFYIIPILNPDGAAKYTRENANGIDLNRDAQMCSQPETKALMRVFDEIKPDLCLNLHGQRTIYGLENRKSATVSFLSPAANEAREITQSREVAMRHITRLATMLQKYIPGQIGRYDDSFNANCVGDTFQMAGVPTILFEAGHYPGDYQREKTRELIFYCFLELFGITNASEENLQRLDYFDIPENLTNAKDFILRNADVSRMGLESDKKLQIADVAIQYEEVLADNAIEFRPKIDSVGDLSSYFGHQEENAAGAEILLNSQENLDIGVEVVTISNKSTPNVKYFSK